MTLMLPILAAPAPPVFRPGDTPGEFVFDTGVLRGRLRAHGESIGLASVVHLPTGLRLDRSKGLFSHYRVFIRGTRFGGGAWDWPSTATLQPDGSVHVQWPSAPDRPFRLEAVYRWNTPDALDLETRVTARQDLAGFESFLACYFDPAFSNALAHARGATPTGPARWLAASPEAGDWQMFPRDDGVRALIQDGRWTLAPNPVEWTLRDLLAEPLAVRRAPSAGLTAVIMADPAECFAVAMPHQTEGHYSLYLSLFGRDLKSGETARARTRFQLLAALTDDAARSAYQAFAQSTAAAPATPNPEDSGAFVRVSPRDPRYFELSNGRPYIPVGLNLIAPPREGGRAGMEAWMARLAAHQGNFIRVWLSQPFFDVEHERSGRYDEAKAQQIDALLAAARTHGLRVKLCLEHFRHLGDGRQAWAAKPLHLVAQGGTATNLPDFFAGEPSRRRFREKLEWFSRRFGNRPEIFGWELWNEINAVQGGDGLAWTEAMLPELHRLFPRNLAMQSLGSYDSDGCAAAYQRLSTMPGNDVAQVHRYLDLGAPYPSCHGPLDLLAVDAVRILQSHRPGRPILLAESGAVEPRHTGPFGLYGEDRAGLLLHDVLFAPFFAGAAGPGHIWHWDVYVDRLNLWYHFARFAEAVRDLDPPAERFEPLTAHTARLRVYALRGRRTVLLWCRDSANTWSTELAEGRAPTPVAGAVLDLGLLWAGRNPGHEARIYDPWEDRWSTGALSGHRVTLPDFRRSLVVRIAWR